MNRNAVIMGIIAVLLSLSVILSVFTFSLRFIMLATITDPFDITVRFDERHDPDVTPADILAEAEKYSEISFVRIYDRYKPDKKSAPEIVQSFDVLAASDFYALSAALGRNEQVIGDDEFMVLYSPYGNDEFHYDNNFAAGDEIEIYDAELDFAGAAADENRNIIRVSGSSSLLDSFIIVPDRVMTETVRQENRARQCMVFNTKEYLPPAFHEKFTRSENDEYRFFLESRYAEIDYLNVQFSVAIVSAVFLGVTFTLMAMALLSLKVMADADLERRRYAILNMLGVDTVRQKKILFRQLFVFFAAPLLIPLLMIVPSVLSSAFISHFFLGYVHGAIYGIGLGVPLVYLGIYLCYFAATYYLSVKNCVRPMEKARLKLLAG